MDHGPGSNNSNFWVEDSTFGARLQLICHVLSVIKSQLPSARESRVRTVCGCL